MPRVSIGLPVYNGETFLSEAIESTLRQTFEDFELIISDNASTDRTEEICRAYAAKDRRICCYRSQENLGAAKNFNRVFELSSAEYFKWAARDDKFAPDYLERCVEVLDQDPSIVLCHGKARVINEHGQFIEDYDFESRMDSPKVPDRFYDVVSRNDRCYQIFGVIRANVLKKTALIGNYTASDRVLLAELSLYGRFHEIPQFLFFPRSHPGQFTRAYTNRHSQTTWFDPAKDGQIIFPKWRIGLGYLTPLRYAPLSLQDRHCCYRYTAQWFINNRRRLLGELVDAGKQILRRSKLVDKLLVAKRRASS